MNDETGWYPLLPADGPAEFPTDDRYTLKIYTRHDGQYECKVVNEATGHVEGEWHLSPDLNIAICIRKTAEQAAADEAAYLEKLAGIFGAPVQDLAIMLGLQAGA